MNKTNKGKYYQRRQSVAKKTTSEVTFAQATRGNVPRQPAQEENDQQNVELLHPDNIAKGGSAVIMKENLKIYEE